MAGSGAGVSVDYSGSVSNGNVDSTKHTNSAINAGQVTVKSGGDTNIAGGNIVADRADLNIGGDLNITSVQDSYHGTADRSNYGGSFGAAVSTNGIIPTLSGHGGGGRNLMI